jgi:hypothetical protein
LWHAEVGEVSLHWERAIVICEALHEKSRGGDRLVGVGVPDLACEKCDDVLNHHGPWLELCGDVGDDIDK